VTRRVRVLSVLGGLLGLFIAWEVVTSYVAFTDDAYVRSDLIGVAPQVTGQLIAVHVADNQRVKRGDLLATIDPVPFQLVIAQRQAQINEAIAQIASDRQAIAAAQDNQTSAAAQVTLARETQRRIAALTATSDVSRQSLDDANEKLRVAQAAQDAAAAAIAEATAQLGAHQAAQARAEAEMGTARWQLDRTRITAPADGTVNALTTRVGDTARENVPLIGIVDAHAWRVIANYKQSYLRGFREGDTAWVWLDSQPWHFHRARVVSIARGISRDPDDVKLLPYVAPTTDWIRLQRRFPVTITLEGAEGLELYMGADARTVILP
jgi:multidrug efflux system membrane fusion protein